MVDGSRWTRIRTRRAAAGGRGRGGRDGGLRLAGADGTGDAVDAAARSPDITVQVLGGFEVSVAERPVVSWRGARVRTVFQYLLLADRPVRREVLMDLMWPGFVHASARNNLNVCLYGLRKALGGPGGPEHVVYRDGSYTLNERLAWSVDRRRFLAAAERMRSALARGDPDDAVEHGWSAAAEYRGPLLDGEPTSGWSDTERTALAEQFARTLHEVADLLLRRGDVEGATRAAERLLEQEPCRESAHRLLMRCFARRHETDRVVRQFRSCVARLRAEFDVAPSVETVRLFRELTDPRSAARC